MHDPAMRAIYDMLDVIGPSPLSVLVLGETGTGKEVFANGRKLNAREPLDHRIGGGLTEGSRGIRDCPSVSLAWVELPRGVGLGPDCRQWPERQNSVGLETPLRLTD
jgi:Sigma-54 interaction domain